MKPNCLIDISIFAALTLCSVFAGAGKQQSTVALSNPAALAFDNSGNLYVASSPGTIVKFSVNGTRSIFASEVLGSGGLAFDNAGNLFVLDADFHSIAKFSPDGTKTIFATGIRNAQGLQCDKLGDLFVSEVGTESILRFTANGTKSTLSTGIQVPRGMAFDSSGNLLVYDALSNSIFKISPDGTRREFARGISASGLILDKADNLFVADVSSQSIVKFDPGGSRTTFVPGIPAPGGLAFDKTGDLFVSDQGTNWILKFATDGTKTVFYEGESQQNPAEGEEGKDSSSGLPSKYATDYLIASSTISPDKKFAVIYPTLEVEEAAGDSHPERIKDLVVRLQPFTVLGQLKTKYPYFQNENHGGISAEWSADSSVALITLDGKWGPRDVLLVQLKDDKLARMISILARAHDLLVSDFRRSKAEPYNDSFDFIFDGEDGSAFKLDDTSRVVIDGLAVTDPKNISEHRWHAHLKASWNIKQAAFTEKKITRD